MSIRSHFHIFGALAGFAALCALPATAQDNAPAKPAAANAATSAGQPLAQALTTLATADGFEVRGLDRLGDETVPAPNTSATPVQALRRILNGYAYTVELAPAGTSGADSRAGKLVRVSILGHVGDNIADASAPVSAPAQPVDSGTQPATGNMQAGPVHPVNTMLQSLARSTIPPSLSAATAAAASQPGVISGDIAGVPAAVSSDSATSSSGTSSPAAASSGATSTDANTAPTADMAALTRTASANLSALVQSLKAACPAGGKC